MSCNRDLDHVLKALIARATTDLEFRKKLLKDPGDAIFEATGVRATVRVKFVEKDPAVDVQIVLPDYVPGEAELQPDELDAVAGGGNWCQFSCTNNTED